MKNVPRRYSNWRATQSLSEHLVAQNTVAIAGIDTRKLTRILRDKGAQAGCIVSGFDPAEADAVAQRALAAARDFPGLAGMDLARVVSRTETQQWSAGQWRHAQDGGDDTPPARYHVVAYDFGVKTTFCDCLCRPVAG